MVIGSNDLFAEGEHLWECTEEPRVTCDASHQPAIIIVDLSAKESLSPGALLCRYIAPLPSPTRSERRGSATVYAGPLQLLRTYLRRVWGERPKVESSAARMVERKSTPSLFEREPICALAEPFEEEKTEVAVALYLTWETLWRAPADHLPNSILKACRFTSREPRTREALIEGTMCRETTPVGEEHREGSVSERA